MRSIVVDAPRRHAQAEVKAATAELQERLDRVVFDHAAIAADLLDRATKAERERDALRERVRVRHREDQAWLSKQQHEWWERASDLVRAGELGQFRLGSFRWHWEQREKAERERDEERAEVERLRAAVALAHSKIVRYDIPRESAGVVVGRLPADSNATRWQVACKCSDCEEHRFYAASGAAAALAPKNQGEPR